MSARLSATTKDLVKKAYENRMKDITHEMKTISDNIEGNIREQIKKSAEYDDFVRAAKVLRNYIETNFPDVHMYSTIRDAARIDDNCDIIYMNWSEKDAALAKNERYNELKEQEKELIKEQNNLLFKLENAPKKSKEYEEAYEKLQEIISVYG